MLSDEQITKFQMLYKKHFGKEISRDKAYEKGLRLIRLIRLIYGSSIEDEYGKLPQHCEEANSLQINKT